MVKVTCECLNVIIHVKNEDLLPINILKIGLSDVAYEKEEFFQQKVCEAHLDSEGVAVKHGFLVRSTACKNWQLYQCVNCLMWTHAVCPGSGQTRILLSAHLKDSAFIERLVASSDYSPLYQVIIHTRNTDQPIRNQGLQSEKFESLQQTLSSIQTQLSECLNAEEAATEERIRLFEQEQRAKLTELQSKARRDKNAMISLVLANAEQFDSSTDSAHANSQSLALTNFNALRSSQSQREMGRNSNLNANHTKSNQNETRNKSYSSKRRAVPKPVDNDDALFDLDGFGDDDNQPFYDSEDDDNDTSEDSSLQEDISPTSPQHMYSSSVPVTVPTWSRRLSIKDDDEEREPAPDPEHMAASIKALAQSVHNDGTSIFGDLPRRRLNTLDSGRPF